MGLLRFYKIVFGELSFLDFSKLRIKHEEEEKPIITKTLTSYPLRLHQSSFQFFAKKKVEEEEVDDIDDDEEEEEEEEEEPKPKRKPKSKSKEERPSWVNELLEAIKPKEQANNQTQKVPVPPKPKVEEEEEPEVEELEEVDNKPKKKSFLSWFL